MDSEQKPAGLEPAAKHLRFPLAGDGERATYPIDEAAADMPRELQRPLAHQQLEIGPTERLFPEGGLPPTPAPIIDALEVVRALNVQLSTLGERIARLESLASQHGWSID